MSSPADKRKHTRKKMLFSPQVTAMTRGNDLLQIGAGCVFTGTEISAGGMAIETNTPLQVDDRLSIHFMLPGESRALAVTGRVKSTALVAATEPGGRSRLRVGIQFENLAHDDLVYLTNYIGSTFLLY